MRIAVIGSRSLFDGDSQDAIRSVLNDHKDEITTLVSGGAKGVDKIGEHWAKMNEVETLIFLPEWEKYGRGAGMKRNTTIVENSDLVLAFWDGKSRGTMDSVKKAQKLGTQVKVYRVSNGKAYQLNQQIQH